MDLLKQRLKPWGSTCGFSRTPSPLWMSGVYFTGASKHALHNLGHNPHIRLRCPPTDGERLKDFYHNWTNSISQQLKRKLWEIADELFRISSITNSFQSSPAGECCSYSLARGPQNVWNFQKLRVVRHRGWLRVTSRFAKLAENSLLRNFSPKKKTATGLLTTSFSFPFFSCLI